jgi:hypothetical protein
VKLRIEVIKNHEQPIIIEGISAKSGKPYKLVKQKAYCHTGGAFPIEFEMMVGEVQNCYAVGMYEVDCKSFEVDARANLIIGRDLVLLNENPINKVA